MMEVDQANYEAQFAHYSGKEFTEPTTIVPPQSLDELIARLHQVFAYEHINVDYVKALMNSYKSKRSDWKKYAKFDRHRYTRNLVDEGNGKFNLIVLCWNESQGSSIHAHADAHCFMKVLDGSLQETMYAWPEGSNGTWEEDSKEEDNHEMRSLGSNQYNKDETAYICDAMGLHRVENTSHSDKAVSLHLYSPPFSECKCFDEKTGHCIKAKVTFWSKYGQRTPFGKSEVKAADAENN